MPSRRHRVAMLSSPRKPSTTMRIFSSAENRRRVFRRMSLTIFSADASAPLARESLLALLRKCLLLQKPKWSSMRRPASCWASSPWLDCRPHGTAFRGLAFSSHLNHSAGSDSDDVQRQTPGLKNLEQRGKCVLQSSPMEGDSSPSSGIREDAFWEFPGGGLLWCPIETLVSISHNCV
jgi:hypothetical protein